ncbi:MAG: DUF411 domain-containing protein [Cellvibrionaceae bacterium]
MVVSALSNPPPQRFRSAGWFIGLFLFSPFLLFYLPTVDAESFIKPSLDSLRPLTVYKRDTCACCDKWVDHLEESGINTRVKLPDDLSALKKDFGIEPQYQACHTGVKLGYVFEGHIPADVVQKFLAEKPEGVIGLSVPGMPFGSPGMETDQKQFRPYKVFMLKKGGGSAIYAKVSPEGIEYPQP